MTYIATVFLLTHRRDANPTSPGVPVLADLLGIGWRASCQDPMICRKKKRFLFCGKTFACSAIPLFLASK
jgi:hypothetical protein